MIAESVVGAVYAREQGMCAVCGLHIEASPHLHHRKPRGMGGSLRLNTVQNLVLLHPSCHLLHVERKRAQAIDNGWLIVGLSDPGEVPMMYMLDRWVILAEDGSVTEVEQPQEQLGETK